MSTVDLILLGLVYEQPRSAYEIQKHVEYRNLDHWVKISSPSIYKKVIRLEEKGYLTSRQVQEGKMPQKTIYAITDLGREYFKELMQKMAAAPVNLLFEFNAVVANLNKMPKDEALSLIRMIKESTEQSLAFTESMVPERQHIPLVGRTILEQQVQVYHTLIDWVTGFEAEFAEKGSAKTGEIDLTQPR